MTPNSPPLALESATPRPALRSLARAAFGIAVESGYQYVTGGSMGVLISEN